MAKLKLPFELEKPSANEFVTQASEIGYGGITVACGLIYDISVANAVNNVPAKYESLSAALGTNGANIPQDIRRGGMGIKFIQSSGNKYIQARCMAQDFTTDVAQWQAVDDIPTAGSDNLVKSGGVKEDIAQIASLTKSYTTNGYELKFSQFPTLGKLKDDGSIDKIANSNKTTDYILLSNIRFITYYHINTKADGYAGICLYDENFVFIASLDGGYTSEQELDYSEYPNAIYVRFCAASNSNARITINYSNQVSGRFIGEKSSCKLGCFVLSTGVEAANNNYCIVEIPVNYGSIVSFNQYYVDAACCVFVKYDGSFEGYSLSGDMGSNIEYTVPKDCRYLRISCLKRYLYLLDIKVDNATMLISSVSLDNNAIDYTKTTFLKHDEESDFITGWIENYYINGNGVCIRELGLWATDKVPLEENVDYYWTGLINGYYAFYDKYDNVIESHGNNTGTLNKPFQVPPKTAYGRFTAPNATYKNRAYISLTAWKKSPFAIILNKELNAYCNYQGEEISVFNKGICIGDSLTQGVFNYGQSQYLIDGKYSYPTFLSKISGIEIDNYGVGGYTSSQWWERYSNEDLSGYDFAIIQLGVNDVIRNITWNSESEDAFTNIINKLKSENNNIFIFVATIIPAISYWNDNYANFSESIRSFVSNLNDEHVIVCDIAKWGHTRDSIGYNAGHLSAYGYWQLAKDYKSLISYIISSNKAIFRKIQFIGTNYDYTD